MRIEEEQMGMTAAKEVTQIDALLSKGGKRTLFEKGGSNGLTLPKPLLEESELVAGDDVLVVPTSEAQAICKIVPVPE